MKKKDTQETINIDDFLIDERNKILLNDPKSEPDAYDETLSVACELSEISYEEECRRDNHISTSINYMLLVVSFIFVAYITLLVNTFNANEINYKIVKIIFYSIEGLLISLSTISLILAAKYRPYNCYNNIDKQLKGTFSNLYSKDDKKYLGYKKSLKNEIHICDLQEVYDSLVENFDIKKKFLKIAIFFILLFILMFLVSIVLFMF